MPRARAGALLLAIVLVLGGCRLESDPAQETTQPGGGQVGSGQTFSSPMTTPPEGEDGEPEETESPDPLADADVKVSLVDFSFDPDEFSVSATGTVAFVNDGTVTHNVSFKEDLTGTDLEPGEGTVLDASTLNDNSAYGLVCKYHQGQEMQATLHVEAA
jgi:plastocyanin